MHDGCYERKERQLQRLLAQVPRQAGKREAAELRRPKQMHIVIAALRWHPCGYHAC
jgi:hypothetical protein